jgi:prepilin-type N-terminal cleavage/methylation domain-containing protein
MRSRRGFTLVELLTAIMIAVLGLALLTPVFAAGTRRGRIEDCAARLKTLYQAAASTEGPAPAGQAYWTRLAPSKVAPETLRCPLATGHPLKDGDYLGPSDPGAKLKGDAPLGCDLPENHSLNGKQGGNILQRSGRVLTDHTTLWAAALHGGCRP